MASELSKTKWVEILQNEGITKDHNLRIFQVLFANDDKELSSSQIGKLLGFRGKNTSSPVNSSIGWYAKRIAKYYDIDFTVRSKRKYKYWDLFFTGRYKEKLFLWKLKPELVKALEITKFTGDIQYPNELSHNDSDSLLEGIKRTIIVNSYERNPQARSECIKYYKAICQVCEFNFQEIYGEIGEGYIHVHHLTPIHKIGKTYEVNPIEDLIPVCPNCHAMLHMENPPIELEALKKIIKDNCVHVLNTTLSL